MGNLKLFAGNQQYKYLGFGESLTTDKTTKLSLKNEYFKRLKMILKSELSSKHIFEAINSYAILALLYGFPVLNRTITKLEIINRETRKMLQKYHVMHSQSDVIWLYLPRKNGGRGLIKITNHYRWLEEKNLSIRRRSNTVMKLAMIFNNWLPWENCRGNPPSYPHLSTNLRQNSKERICMDSLQNTLNNSFTLKRATELTIAAIQEQAISTKYI